MHEAQGHSDAMTNRNNFFPTIKSANPKIHSFPFPNRFYEFHPVAEYCLTPTPPLLSNHPHHGCSRNFGTFSDDRCDTNHCRIAFYVSSLNPSANLSAANQVILNMICQLSTVLRPCIGTAIDRDRTMIAVKRNFVFWTRHPYKRAAKEIIFESVVATFKMHLPP